MECHNGEKVVKLGETFTVKTPGKAADIVVLVSTETANEHTYKDLVQPAIQQVTNELHSKGVR